MQEIPFVIGYDINKALELLGEKCKVEVITTSTPYGDKKEERIGITPVVIRQNVKDDIIILTVSCFKKSLF